ncbi:MFS transporter [Aestuariibius sp. 2305UL40-4]|uniref:MFS transporter n=1 Tax=Aestuariibius violaceus TaxID=3234132 RepID=UPI00345ED9E7
MPTDTNIRLYPWFKATQSLLFWQAIWFLYFQEALTPAAAILLYAVYDIVTTILEVPSGYLSDRLGRRPTLILSALAMLAGAILLAIGGPFWVFALGQGFLGLGAALVSGTDSAFLYESLAAEDRADEVERHELRAWRATFTALALSAVTGGLLYSAAVWLPFATSAAAFCAMVVLTLRFREPPRRADSPDLTTKEAIATLGPALRNPVLGWIFALSLLMYVYSHIPFVFGQPFILDALSQIGLAAEAPMVSGAVTTLMMLLSVGTSIVAPRLRERLGLAAILLAAFGLQIALSGALALTSSAAAIGLLMLRMVPDSLSRPFILARIQPLLADESRATYLSLQSLAGRILFAATLFLAAGGAAGADQMSHSEIQVILGWYAAAGIGCLATLALAARRIPVDPK